MLDPNNPLLSASYRQKNLYGDDHNQPLFDRALGLFNRSIQKSKLVKIWYTLTRQAHKLYNLADIHQQLAESRYAGLQPVPIDLIRGSESRVDDFDIHFNPLREKMRDRWLSIAMAYSQGVALPPVSLIQVGGIYFVRDGHHRISVALARGQEVIDAEVIVIEYRGSLPWQTRNDSERSRMQTKPEPRYCSAVSGR
jgi:hypothetical protein